MADGFQMEAQLDETNGVVHCRIRNATTNTAVYSSFDFGYFEYIHLEIRSETNWTKLCINVFPPAAGYSGGGLRLLKHIERGQVVTNTHTRGGFRPWPVLQREEYLKWSQGDTNQALLTESLNRRAAAREALLINSCAGDTFALDLIGDIEWPDLPKPEFVEARVSQMFSTSKGTTVTLYSPVFTLNASQLKTYSQQRRTLLGR